MTAMTLQQFAKAYHMQNEHDVVPEPEAVRRNWAVIIPLMIGLIAANVLSAFHTGPLIAAAFKTIVFTPEYDLMFIVGVLAVEFTIFIIMFVSWDNTTARDKVLRIFVILLALSVAMIANVSGAINNLGTTGTADTLAGGLVGVFAPLANLAIAEVLRTILNRTKQERDLAMIDYRAELKKADLLMRNRYVNYLKKVGITDPTQVMKLSAGELPVEEPKHAIDPVPTTEVRYLNLPQEKSKNKAEQLADVLQERGDTALSFKQIEQRYSTNPATVNAAKKILRERGLIN